MRLKPFVETVFVSFRQLKVLKPPDLNPVERLWVGGLGLNRGDITAHLQGVWWSPCIKPSGSIHPS